MNKYLLIFILITLTFIFIIPNILGKYIICASDSISYSINIDNLYPVLTITDINNSIINNGDIAITSVMVSFSSNISNSYYEYSINADFSSSPKYNLENTSTLSKSGNYRVTIIDINGNTTQVSFELRKGVCKDELNRYYLSLSDALKLKNNCKSEITLLANISEDSSIFSNMSISINVNSYKLYGSFNVSRWFNINYRAEVEYVVHIQNLHLMLKEHLTY